jgi:ATP-binding cassette subfamily B multidrug efflux pump
MSWMLDSVNASMRLTTWMTTTLFILAGFLIFSTSALAVWLWYHQAITLGAIAFSIGLTLRLKAMSQWIIWEVAGLFEDIGVVHDGIETIARDRTVTDAEGALPLNVPHGEIRFENLRFNYGKVSGKPAVDGINLVIRPGEKVGLVGRSGAGKSTLTSLLLRFYDTAEGRIVIDGQDIAMTTQESLRANIGMVTQDTSLLHRSVRDNILYGKPGASEAEMIAAAEKAHAHEFIGGQRQRVAIARVLLKNAPILILDEATSALDSEVEAAIQESLYTLMEGKTVIAVAHRLSTIAAMDRLIVMDEGRIVEDGPHQALLRRRGIYAALWERQSGGFLAQAAE